METTSSSAAAEMQRETYLTISLQKLFFFLQAQGPLMPYLKAIKLLKAFLRILCDDISSACSISKRRKETGLEWGEKNKTKTNQLGFLVVRSNAILFYIFLHTCIVQWKDVIISKVCSQSKLNLCTAGSGFPSFEAKMWDGQMRGF